MPHSAANWPTEDEFASIATFTFPDEAAIVCGLVRSSGILCYLENDQTLAKVWPWSVTLGGLRLMVPSSLAAEVRELLDYKVPEEDVLTASGADELVLRPTDTVRSCPLFADGRTGGAVRLILAIAVLCAPAIESLSLVHIGP
jgi:hypothetical protein